MILLEMMLEVVMGVVDMEVDKVADEVNNMVDENGPIGRNLMNMYKGRVQKKKL